MSFYSTPVCGRIATGHAFGCCLRCIYCWSNWSRDFMQKFGEFYSPNMVAERLVKPADEGITSRGWERFRHPKVNKLRLSGCEPTLGKEHLLAVLEHLKSSKYQLIILKPNGILFGSDRINPKHIGKFIPSFMCAFHSRLQLPSALLHA